MNYLDSARNRVFNLIKELPPEEYQSMFGVMMQIEQDSNIYRNYRAMYVNKYTREVKKFCNIDTEDRDAWERRTPLLVKQITNSNPVLFDFIGQLLYNREIIMEGGWNGRRNVNKNYPSNPKYLLKLLEEKPGSTVMQDTKKTRIILD